MHVTLYACYVVFRKLQKQTSIAFVKFFPVLATRQYNKTESKHWTKHKQDLTGNTARNKIKQIKMHWIITLHLVIVPFSCLHWPCSMATSLQWKPLHPPWSCSSILRTDYWLYAPLCPTHRDPRTQTYEHQTKKYRLRSSCKNILQIHTTLYICCKHDRAQTHKRATHAWAHTDCTVRGVHDPHVCHSAVCFALYNRV